MNEHTYTGNDQYTNDHVINLAFAHTLSELVGKVYHIADATPADVQPYVDASAVRTSFVVDTGLMRKIVDLVQAYEDDENYTRIEIAQSMGIDRNTLYKALRGHGKTEWKRHRMYAYLTWCDRMIERYSHQW